MQRKISAFIGVLSAVLLLPSFSSAAVSYSRTPSGTSITSPVTFNITLTQAEMDSIGVGPPVNEPSAAYWCIQPNDIVTSAELFSEGVPISQLSHTFTMNLQNLPQVDNFPVGYTAVVVFTAPAATCTSDNVFGGGFNVEGDGSEVIFTIPGPVTPATGGVAGPVQYPPEVNILSPKAADVFGGKAEIKYQAKDQNDATGGAGAERFGLAQNPVSIYLVDNIDILPGKRVADEDKKLIAKELAAERTFLWDTKDIPDGFFYRVVIDAVDKYGDAGESVSPIFSIDHTAPVFTAKADPIVSRGENVKITVASSKDLVRQPKVVVTQRGFRPVEIGMEGFKRNFEGTYYVSTGYDGPAVISVTGEDLVGNAGDVIASGGSFSVGVEPPPQPLIFSPIDKDITTSQVVKVEGRAREDTEVVVSVNGKDKYKTKPDKDGNFTLDGVRLYPDFNKGVNFVSVVARDTAGNTSEAVSLSVKFNLTPELAILYPQKSAVLTGTTTIRVSATDKNNDVLNFIYEVGRPASPDGTVGAGGWNMLVEKTSRKQIVWRTADFADGEYRIRVTASDGTTKTEVISEAFLVKNNLPAISFDGGEKTIANKKDVALAGGILSPENTILGLDYSLDGGKSWLAAAARDGAFNSASENFTVNLTDLKEGLYTILFRARDARGLYGRATKTLIIDFGPPPVPIAHLEAKPPSEVVSDADDENGGAAGVQFTLLGNSEAQSRVSAAIDGKTFSAKANENGEFKISGVTLRNHGKNEIVVFAADLAENKSAETKISLIYNNPPVLKFLSPRDGRGLNHKAVVRWEAADQDGDKIESMALSYRRGSGEFKVLVKSQTATQFGWDVSDFSEGRDYELKLEASDGVSSSGKIVSFIVDNTPPEISLEPLAKTAFNKSFTLAMRGSARDNFSGVEFVEYSIDGEHWFKALISDGFLQNSAAWTLRHPFVLEDGVYTLRVRAVDAAGNISKADTQTILVDTTPPRIGSYTFSHKNISILPEAGIFKILVDTNILMDISMEKDTAKAEVRISPQPLTTSPPERDGVSFSPPLLAKERGVGGEVFPSPMVLTKNKATGLWQAELNFPETGTFDLLISAEDALGNKTGNSALGGSAFGGKKIGEVDVVRKGKTEPQAKITVFLKQPEAGFVRWQGEAYGADNPVLSDSRGEYQFLLPSGQYQLLVQKLGFERLRTSEFELINPAFVNFDFPLTPRKGLRGAIEDLLERFNL